VILDVFSRYVVGWMLASYESGVLAEDLIATCCIREHIARDQLTIHADRGPAMIAKPVALLPSDLGITKSHSRPHVSSNNPYSEAFQNAQISAGLSHTLWLARRCARAPHGFLRLVHHRTSAQRHRVTHPARRAPSSG